MKKQLFLLLPIFTMSLMGCSSNGKHHDIKEYKAGEITITDDDFQILQLCDIHLSNKDNQEMILNFLDLTITDAINDGVDLIVLDGDVFTFADQNTADKFFSFLDGHNVPWTMTFGNHDEQCYFSVTHLTNYLNNYGGNCIFKDIQGDDIKGNANFFIDVKKGDELFERVIIMDSNRYHFSTDYIGYDYIYPEQIEWYKEVVSQPGSPKSLIFFHIPLPEFDSAANNPKKEDILIGDNQESSGAPIYNSGFFEEIEKLENTQGIFCAHAHVNDSVILYSMEGYSYKVALGYGTHSTDRIYGVPEKMGGMLITIDSTHILSSSSFKQYHHQYSEVEGK